MGNQEKIPASFRDPSGFIFWRDGSLYRQVNKVYQENYDHLVNSGLLNRLVESGLLIPHTEVDFGLAYSGEAYRVIQPRFLEFVSYPYEWSFSQLKAAALATLQIEKIALKFGMSLKDGSAYNIQFLQGKPVLIDTLSFEVYQEDTPWVPYRQFCQHFLAPLALMAYKDVRLSQLLRVFIDGIPLDLASGVLPASSYLNVAVLLHLHLHARSQRHFKGTSSLSGTSIQQQKMKPGARQELISNLEAGIQKLKWAPGKTAWANYYQDNSYSAQGLRDKQQVVKRLIQAAAPKAAWDLGANTGLFSRIASSQGIPTVAWDIDPGAVELNFKQVTAEGEQNLLPLLLDLSNPSAAIGWHNKERMSFEERGPVDLVMALALIHHLAISNNTPLDRIAQFLAGLCNWLIIEFVPKEDPKVQTLLSTRVDIFDHYTRQGFEAAFSQYFDIQCIEPVKDSLRILYLMKEKQYAR